MADIAVNLFRVEVPRVGTQPSNPATVEGVVLPPVNPPGDGLINTFIQLNDTPSTYSGEATKIVSVKSDESGLEFVTLNGSTPIYQVFTYSSSNVFSLSDPDPTVIYVALNGQVLTEGSIYDYTVSGTQLTVTTPLLSGDEITILYYSNAPRISLYGRNIDGGSPDSVYLPIQNVDGGTP